MSDVGKLAGVSHQTVSRVLNGNSYVSAETRRRVEQAIRDLRFRPNQAARSLVLSRSDSVGVITMGGADNGSLGVVLQGIRRAAADLGYRVSVNTLVADRSDADAEQLVEAAFERFISEGVDGLIIISAYTGVLDIVRSKAADLPIVLVFGEPVDGAGTATIDPVTGGRLVAEHLVALGHREIVHVAGPENRFDSRGRESGFRAELAASGLEPRAVLRGTWSAESGYRIGLELRDRRDFTAIFSGNDQMALGLIHAFGEVGRHAPSDFSIAGYDDLPEAAHYLPPLTTVRQDYGEVGRRSFTELEAAIRGESFTDVTLQPELIVRRSTGAPAP